MRRALAFGDTDPFVRYVHVFAMQPGSPFTDVAAYDHRLIYILDGAGHLVIGGVKHGAAKGTLLLWEPGVTYSYCPDRGDRLSILGVNFDYTRDKSHLALPIPPQKAGGFNRADITELVTFTDAEALNRPVCLHEMAAVENTLLDLAYEYTSRKVFGLQKVRGLFLTAIGEIGRVVCTSHRSLSAHSRADMVLQYIHERFRDPISNADIADYAGFHPVYVNRLMLRHTGLSLHRYLLNYRVAAAMNLLQTTHMSLGEIAEATGFHDASHVSRCFRKAVGQSPRHWVASHAGR